MKDIKKIYRDKTGWREVNPFSRIIEPGKYYDFEQSITYYEFPNAPDIKEGEIVEAYLQLQHKLWSDSEWSEGKIIHIGLETRQIWALAGNQEGKDEQAKESKHICLDCNYQSDTDPKYGICPECGGCHYIDHFAMKSPSTPKVEASAADLKSVKYKMYFDDIDKCWREIHEAIHSQVTEKGWKDFYYSVIRYQKELVDSGYKLIDGCSNDYQYATLKSTALQSKLQDKQRTNDYLVQRIDVAEVKLMDKEKEIERLKSALEFISTGDISIEYATKIAKHTLKTIN